METELLIVALAEHSVFGWKYNVYSAQACTDGSECLQILGVPDRMQEKRRGLPDALQQLISLAGEISDRELMKACSRSKSTAGLKNGISKSRFDSIVRPRIEAANRKITELLLLTGVPVFLRRDLSGSRFYEHDRIHLLPDLTHCVFRLVKDDEGLLCSVSLTSDGKAVSLYGQRGVVISGKPGIVLIGRHIHRIENIEAKKLMPFFTKKHVRIPSVSEEVYLQNFVSRMMPEYEVHIEGITVRQLHPDKNAFLSLERDINGELTLILSFAYGDDKQIYPDNPMRKMATLEQEDGRFVICWYERDRKWENRLAEKLLREGLTRRGTHHFYPESSADPYRLIEWLNRKPDVVSRDFTLLQSSDLSYFTGAVVQKSSYEEQSDRFDVQMTVAIGRYQYPLSRFRRYILSGKREFVLPDNRLFILPSEWFEKYTELFLFGWEENRQIRLRKMHVQTLELALRGELPEKDAAALRNFLQASIDPSALPEHLHAMLRPYQREGFCWLERLYRHGFGGCLADDMGLGKTVQTIALLQYVYDAAETESNLSLNGQMSLFSTPQSLLPASLVVAPVSLLHNWHNELKRFAPHLRTMIYAGNNRRRKGEIGSLFRRYQVVITSYGTVRNDIACLCEYPFQVLVLDESQYIKNPDSQSFRAVMQLAAVQRLALTGTPIENSLEDLWAQFTFINKGFLGNYATFRKRFIQPIMKDRDEQQETRLKRVIAPFLLRRTKEQVTPDLPPLQQEIIYCDMTAAQEAAYEEEKNSIRQTMWQTGSMPDQKDRFTALEGLNRLRQTACHPRLIRPEYAGDSGKFEQIILALENLRAGGHKALVFSSYVRHLRLLAGKFEAEGRPFAMLTGEMTGREREEAIRRFTDDPQVHCFFISLKAGGVGLNLTAADYVFIVDPWWNPAAEMQALSRAHRIGQDKPVIACRFISTNTVEEKILRLQESKTALAETFVDTANPFAQFSWEEIAALLR